MTKFKKVLLASIAGVMVIAMAIGGTIAYLTSKDSDVNVMTMGNVEIEQIEQERGENGLKDFAQDKAAFPYTGSAEPTDVVKIGGKDYALYPTAKNAVDKIVTVKNTGKSSAYVRTIVAVEVGTDGQNPVEFTANYAKENSDWEIEWLNELVECEGVYYKTAVFTYKTALEPGVTTMPSLLQVYLNPSVDNEDVERLGGAWEVYVLSQAVQTAGFEPETAPYSTTFSAAKTALDEAFKPATVSNVAVWIKTIADEYAIDVWDGTADTSWYNDTDKEFVLANAEQFAGLAELVDAGNTFEGKTILLEKDLDLGLKNENGEPVSFDPIGDDSPFMGTLDGQGNTISNMYQSGWAFNYEWGQYGSIGLFGELKNATVKNVTISGAEGEIEGGDIGGIAGSASGVCVFENITIENTKLGTYNNGNGGIIGWSGAGEYTFKNIKIAEDVVLGGLWGSFDSSIGGVVGQGEPGATYNFENVDIACRIDAYNDVTASYDYYNYRMCGMIIGRLAKTTTIDGVNYPDTSQYNITCDNVTVTYGEWANYHYCRPEGGRGIRVEAGYAYGGIATDYDHSTCTVHHMELIEFDQIFGGDQYAVKGLKAYDGVKVIYNNK